MCIPDLDNVSYKSGTVDPILGARSGLSSIQDLYIGKCNYIAARINHNEMRDSNTLEILLTYFLLVIDV